VRLRIAAITLLLRRSDGMHVSKKLTVISFKSVTSKNTHLTYLLSIFYCVVAHIDLDIYPSVGSLTTAFIIH